MIHCSRGTSTREHDRRDRAAKRAPRTGALTIMNVLLINPPCGPRTVGLRHIARIEPLNLELLGAAVSGECDVRVVDMEVAPGDLERVLAEFGLKSLSSTPISRDPGQPRRQAAHRAGLWGPRTRQR